MDNIKFIASQARSIYQYKSLRTEVLKFSADVFFNKQCLVKNTVPYYANINVPITSQAAHFTKGKIFSIRIKDEIKFLHKKKTNLKNNSTKVT
jgi:hypothetical protein